MAAPEPALLSGRSAVRGRLPQLLAYAGSSASLLGGSVAQLVAFAILARSLGVEQFGQFLAITAVTNVTVQLCGLGAMEPLVRRVARDKTVYPAFLGHNVILGLVSGLIISVGLLFFLPYFFASSVVATDVVFLAAVFGITNTILLRGILLTEQIFIAHSMFAKANAIAVGFGLMRAATAAAACFLFAVTDLTSWALWHAGGHLVFLMVCLWVIRPLGAPLFEIQWDEVKRGLFFCWALIGQSLRQNIDLLVLGLVASPALVGSFGVARRIADTSYLSVNALNRITYPRLSIAMEHSIRDGLAISQKVLAAAVAISISTAVAVYFIAPVLPLLFGDDYVDMVPFLRAICWIVIPFSLATVAAEVLGASGHHGIRAMIFNATIVGSVFIGVMTYWFLAAGTIIALFVVEIALACAFWFAVIWLLKREVSREDMFPQEKRGEL